MRFYKYLSSQDAKKILETMNIGFSKVDSFNDPFEISYKTLFEASLEDVDERLKDRIANRISVHDRENRIFKREIIDSFYVFCGSREWNNLLMWAHYADKYNGIVLGFGDAATFLNNRYLGSFSESINEYNKNIDIKILKHFHVIYSNERPDYKMDTPELELLKWKAREWSYEEEWRVVLYDPKDENSCYENGKLESLDKNDLKEVIFGPKMDMSFYKQYISIVKQNYTNVKIYKAKLSPIRFEIEKELIERIGA